MKSHDKSNKGRARSDELSDKDRARFDELSAKRANPNVPPPDMRTEDEEMEWRELSERDARARGSQESDAADAQVKENEKRRKAEVKDAQSRIDALVEKVNRTPAEDDELRERKEFVANDGMRVDHPDGDPRQPENPPGRELD